MYAFSPWNLGASKTEIVFHLALAVCSYITTYFFCNTIVHDYVDLLKTFPSGIICIAHIEFSFKALNAKVRNDTVSLLPHFNLQTKYSAFKERRKSHSSHLIKGMAASLFRAGLYN